MGRVLEWAYERRRSSIRVRRRPEGAELSSNRETDIERALIDAMSRRDVEHFDPEKRRDQDTAYAEVSLIDPVDTERTPRCDCLGSLLAQS